MQLLTDYKLLIINKTSIIYGIKYFRYIAVKQQDFVQEYLITCFRIPVYSTFNKSNMLYKRRAKCPICGNKVVGRSDKKFCSDGCRVFYNNLKYRKKHKSISQNRDIAQVFTNAVFLNNEKSYLLLKILKVLSHLFKIISIFGSLIIKNIKIRI